MSNNLFVEVVKQDEGFRGQPYVCTGGATTIGYGRNLDANPLTEDEAEMMLRRDLISVVCDLYNLLGAHTWVEMGEWRQAALVTMRYQLGHAGFRGFKAMLEALNRHDWQSAALEMAYSRWAMQTPNRMERCQVAMRDNVNSWEVEP